MSRSNRAAMLLAAVALTLTACSPPPPPFNASEVSGIAYGKDIGIADTSGQIRRIEDFKDQVTLVFFGFTRCPDVCPTSLNLMARLREKLGPDGNKFEIVFVSVDPEHDSPKTVGDYVDLFGTPIIGLTGSDQQIAKVAKSYGVYVEKVPLPGGDFTIDHTASIFLMDRNGELVSTIDNHEDPEIAMEKLEKLVIG